MRRFRLLEGSHVENHPTRKEPAGPGFHGPDGKMPMIPTSVMYKSIRAGGRPGIDDIIETENDLTHLNPRGYPPKFEALDLEPAYMRETDIRPGESLTDFAKRMADLAVSRPTGQEVPTATIADAAKAGYDTIYTDSGKQPPVTVKQLPGNPAPAWNPAEHKALLESMTVAELKKHAEEEEIPLGNARTKEELIRLILAGA